MLGCSLLAFVGLPVSGALTEPPHPEPIPVSFASRIPSSVRKVVTPPQDTVAHDDHSLTLRSHGRSIRIWPAMGYAFVEGARFGRDGSLLITRRSSTDMWYVNDFIRSGRREWKVSIDGYETSVFAYRDPQNYVGSYYTEMGVAQYPKSPPTTFAMKGGRVSVFGLGEPVKTWSLDETLVEIPVDTENVPCGLEFFDEDFLRLYDKGRSADIGRFKFVGATPDRTLLLWKQPGVYLWRRGRFLAAYRLPQNWEPVKINRRGEILLKYEVADGVDDPKKWGFGILKNGRLSPLAFSQSYGSDRLFCRDTNGFGDDGSVLFAGYYGSADGTFRIRRSRLPRA